jgi:uncharacterized protein
MQSIGWFDVKLYALIFSNGVQPIMKTTPLHRVLGLSLLVAALSTTAFAQSSINVVPSMPMITVTGNASVEASPDEATVRIGILHQGGSAKEAQEEANKTAQATLKAIGDLGIPPQRIQTSRLTISPMYVQPRPGSNDAPRITGYTASNVITVTLDVLGMIGPVVDAGLQNGANQLEGVQFGLRNDGPPRELALHLAVMEAKGKAAAIADALGVTLGPVQEVSESGSSVVPLGGDREVFAMAARAAVPTPVSTGQIEIRVGVVLKYAIGSKN